MPRKLPPKDVAIVGLGWTTMSGAIGFFDKDKFNFNG